MVAIHQEVLLPVPVAVAILLVVVNLVQVVEVAAVAGLPAEVADDKVE